MNKTFFLVLLSFVVSASTLSAQDYLTSEEAIPVLKQSISEIETDISTNPLPMAYAFSGQAGPGVIRKVKYDFSAFVFDKLTNHSETVESSIQSASDHFNDNNMGLSALELDTIESDIRKLLSN